MTEQNPRTHCIKCGARYGIADESCYHCGFDPMDGDQDQVQQEAAEDKWDRDNGQG